VKRGHRPEVGPQWLRAPNMEKNTNDSRSLLIGEKSESTEMEGGTSLTQYESMGSTQGGQRTRKAGLRKKH